MKINKKLTQHILEEIKRMPVESEVQIPLTRFDNAMLILRKTQSMFELRYKEDLIAKLTNESQPSRLIVPDSKYNGVKSYLYPVLCKLLNAYYRYDWDNRTYELIIE